MWAAGSWSATHTMQGQLTAVVQPLLLADVKRDRPRVRRARPARSCGKRCWGRAGLTAADRRWTGSAGSGRPGNQALQDKGADPARQECANSRWKAAMSANENAGRRDCARIRRRRGARGAARRLRRCCGPQDAVRTSRHLKRNSASLRPASAMPSRRRRRHVEWLFALPAAAVGHPAMATACDMPARSGAGDLGDVCKAAGLQGDLPCRRGRSCVSAARRRGPRRSRTRCARGR